MALYPFTTVGLTSRYSRQARLNPSRLQASEITFQVTVSSIGTNVVVRFEGSLDNTNFFNLDEGR